MNAIRANAAVGGSTNAVIHLIAFAGRVGVPLTLDDWDQYGRDVRDDSRHSALGAFFDGGVLLRGRVAGGAEQAGRAWASSRQMR